MIRRPSAALCSLLLAMLAGAGLRLWTLGFFEFKEEQLGNMLAGMAMPERWFLVSHGIASTVGFPNGAGLFQIMGAIALAGGRTPLFFAAAGVIVSIAAMAVFYRMLCRCDAASARTGLWLLALSPSAVLLAGNIWPHSYLGLIAIGILWMLTAAWEHGKAPWWIGACALTAWGGTVHLSAFFLIPTLIMVGVWMKLRWQYWAAAAGIGAVIVSPWLWFLCFQWDRTLYDAPAAEALWRVWCREFAGCFGGGWMTEYFADPIAPLRPVFGGIGGWVIFGIAAGAPWIGVVRAMAALWRKEPVPKIVAVAVGMVYAVTTGYALLQVRLYFFYFVIMMPGWIVLAAYGWSRFPGWGRRCMTAVWCIAAITVSAAALNDLRYRGGDPAEYGPHIGFWNRCVDELMAEQAVAPLRLEVAVEGPVGDKLSPHVAGFFLMPYHDPEGRPCRITIGYDPVRRCYYHRFVFTE